jgi:hypothetical protein
VPDDVLLEIFAFYVDKASSVGGWYELVHVCQRWRYVVFASSRRLNLQLLCGARTPVKGTLHVWPSLPIVVWYRGDYCPVARPQGADDIIAVFEKHDRVREIFLWDVPSWLLQRFAAASQEPFTELTYLEVQSVGKWVSVLPDTFLGGSAPRLRSLHLNSVPFPGLCKLLLSANSLVTLNLSDVPDSGYISPQMMVTCLSALT